MTKRGIGGPAARSAAVPGSHPARSLGWRALAVACVLALLTFVAHSPALEAEFVGLDDPQYVTKNPHVQAGLTRDGLAFAFSIAPVGHWHPLTWLSHMLDCELYGLRPAGHHLTSVLLHVANTLVVFAVLARATATFWRPAAVAALFALHPLRVESVAWVAERKDVLSVLLGLLTIGAYLRWVERPGAARYLVVVGTFVLGLMAKPMLVTLPVLLLLLDWWPLRRPLTPRLLLEKAPLFVLAGASSLMAIVAAERAGAMAGFSALSFPTRVANAAIAYASYLGKTIWPARLAVFYPLRDGLPTGQVAGAALLLAGLAATALVTARRWPYLAFGFLWFVVSLVPVSGLAQAGQQALADRFTYLPHIGLLVAAVWCVHDVAKHGRIPDYVVATATGSVLAALALATFRQAGHWRTNFTLYGHAVAVTRDNWLAHENLGAALAGTGQLDEAIVHYRAALRARPLFAQAHHDLGVALGRQGELAEAKTHLLEAIARRPEHADAHSNLGNILLREGQLDEAIVQYREAVRLAPESAEAHNNLGVALANRGETADAVAQFAESVRRKPDYAQAHVNLGSVLVRQGKLAAATASYRAALAVEPDRADLLRTVAWLLATNPDAAGRNGTEAVHLAERAVTRTGRSDPDALDALAAAYAEAGRFAEAMDAAEAAEARARSSGREGLAEAIAARLTNYRAGRPYREGEGAPGGP